MNKAYVPKVGSGAYAILITLYKNTLDPHKEGKYFFKKTKF